MKTLSTPQGIQFSIYLDCKKRTKKKTGLISRTSGYTDDEKLIHFLLENSSVLDRESERSFSDIASAIHLICKNLCPGQWCTRGHCKNYSSGSAYFCNQTRPSVCKLYKAYVEKQEKRENDKREKDNLNHDNER